MTQASATITGVAAALVTLFRDDGALDLDATTELARRVAEAEVGSVLVAGTTGEGRWLTEEERARLVAAVRRALPEPFPVLAGVFASTSREAADEAARALDYGATAVVCLSSAEDDPLAFYGVISDSVGRHRVIAYHLPGERPPGIPPDVVAGLPVAGLKDASGDAHRMALLLQTAVPLYVGAPLLGIARAAGCAGAMLALASVAPALCVAVWNGDAEALPGLLARHVELSRNFPEALKETVAGQLGCSSRCRRPPF